MIQGGSACFGRCQGHDWLEGSSKRAQESSPSNVCYEGKLQNAARKIFMASPRLARFHCQGSFVPGTGSRAAEGKGAGRKWSIACKKKLCYGNGRLALSQNWWLQLPYWR
jgi:hypothetical protein